ncbi:hypothetical protein [Aquirhabdus parva]|uniref:Uncharacterized protein n=1 Tax=Aquirhabdus parva TaxID=2283318 RepID=A0A345PA10_9GAMM|nr:hypothetical protein [Aquirhabdus parva]AXI04119.1 hypothetical protein HYN46_15500 [Aquirhabdus parva]
MDYLQSAKVILWSLSLSLSAMTHAEPIRIVDGCAKPEIGVLEPLRSFLDQVNPNDVLSDSTRISILIAVALHQKNGSDIRVRDVAAVMEPPLQYDRRNLIDVRNTIRRLGYDAYGFQMESPTELKDTSGKIAFLVDRQTVANQALMALLFASTAQYKYLLYTNGAVCPIPSQAFQQQFSGSPILFVEEANNAKKNIINPLYKGIRKTS